MELDLGAVQLSSMESKEYTGTIPSLCKDMEAQNSTTCEGNGERFALLPRTVLGGSSVKDETEANHHLSHSKVFGLSLSMTELLKNLNVVNLPDQI